MDWVNATYNKLEALAVAADRVLGAAVEHCEAWMAGGRLTRASVPEREAMGAAARAEGAGSGRSLSA
jgi:hypothetical protein